MSTAAVQDFYLSGGPDQGGRSERYSVPLDGKAVSLGPFPFRPRSILIVNQTTSNLIVTDDRGEQFIAAQSIGATYGTGDSIRFSAQLDKAPVPVQGKATVVVSDQPAGVSAAQLSSFAAISGGAASGGAVLLGYNEYTATVVIAAVTEATATQIVAAPSITFDGATEIMIEFFCPRLQPFGANRTTLVLFEDGVAIGQLGMNLQNSGLDEVIVNVRRYRTPSAGAHVYSVRGFQSAAGGANANAGPGGAGNLVPGFIAVTKVALPS